MAILSRSNSFLLGMGILASLGFSGCGTQSEIRSVTDYSEDIRLRKPDTSSVMQGTGTHLSVALEKNLGDEAAIRKRGPLLAFVQTSIRRSGAKGGEQQFKTCLERFPGAPECSVLKPGWAKNFFEEELPLDDADKEMAVKSTQQAAGLKSTRNFKRQHAKVVEAVYRGVISGNPQPVEGQIQGDYYRALKRVTSWLPELDELAEKLADQKECVDPELYVYLGLKAEEFFPDKDKLKKVMKLYRKADECFPLNTTNKYVQLSRFRFGLLSILRGDCSEATGAFTRLAKMGPSDYSSRALYWNAFCARAESNRDEFLASFDELFRMNPLGFHTLSINNGESVLADNINTPVDPRVKTRTSIEGQYNGWIQLLEDYDRLGDHSMVRLLLGPVRRNPDHLLKLEPGVRLYLSTFAYRVKDTISMFRMLDSVFRAQSAYVVDSTLRLFYPLKYVDQIKGRARKVNPLLIASLIRQESAFQEGVKSRVGALGLMQLMPGTARLIDRGVKNHQLLDPSTNIRIGVHYFETLVERYNGDVELALAAYNAGSEVVDRWQRRYPTRNRLLFLDLMPFAETRNYVTLIGRNYFWYSKIYSDEVNHSNGIAQSSPSEFRALKSR